MTLGRYTPRKSNLRDSTAFSFSPMIFVYFIPAAGSAPTAVMTPHTRAPPALAARQKACGYAISILRTSSSGIFALPLPTPNAASATSTPWACGATCSSSDVGRAEAGNRHDHASFRSPGCPQFEQPLLPALAYLRSNGFSLD